MEPRDVTTKFLCVFTSEAGDTFEIYATQDERYYLAAEFFLEYDEKEEDKVKGDPYKRMLSGKTYHMLIRLMKRDMQEAFANENDFDARTRPEFIRKQAQLNAQPE